MASFSLRSRFAFLSSIYLKNPKPPIFQNFTTISSSDKYYNQLQKNGVNIEQTLATVGDKLDSSCISKVLNKCSSNNNSLLGLRFFIWAGIQSDYRHSSFMYSKACKVLGIRRNPKTVFELIECYGKEKCLVDVKSFKVVLSLCRMANLSDEALWVLRKMPEFNCLPDTTMFNVVIKIFCGKGDLDTADKLMKEMSLIDLYPDMITYITMIKGFCDASRLKDARDLIKTMRAHGCEPNVVAYSALVDGLCRFGSLETALELLGEMEKGGGDCTPNVITYTSVIRSLCEKKRSIEALMILDRMKACGCAPNRVTVSALIKGFCEEGRVDDAYKMIDKMTKEGNVSTSDCYSSFVVSLLRIKHFEEAEKVFRRMLASGLKPDGLACSVMIKQLCLEGCFVDAFRLYDEVETMGCLCSINTDIYSILLAGLCQDSHLVEAATISKIMIEKGVKLGSPYADRIAEHLKISRHDDPLVQITKNNK